MAQVVTTKTAMEMNKMAKKERDAQLAPQMKVGIKPGMSYKEAAKKLGTMQMKKPLGM